MVNCTQNFFNQKGGMKKVLTNLQGILLINWTIKEKKHLTKILEEISNVIKILKPNKSPGEDGIIMRMLSTILARYKKN